LGTGRSTTRTRRSLARAIGAIFIAGNCWIGIGAKFVSITIGIAIYFIITAVLVIAI
jgi:hypothetical protein